MKVAIGSKNPVKVEAVKNAFALLWPNEIFEFISLEVESGINNQPMTDEETMHGALTRAKNVLSQSGADYGIGLESGIHPVGDIWFNSNWAVVLDKKQIKGVGSSMREVVPNKVMELIHEGKELGYAFDQVYGTVDIRKKEGMLGYTTNNTITRMEATKDSVILALTIFLHPEMY